MSVVLQYFLPIWCFELLYDIELESQTLFSLKTIFSIYTHFHSWTCFSSTISQGSVDCSVVPWQPCTTVWFRFPCQPRTTSRWSSASSPPSAPSYCRFESASRYWEIKHGRGGFNLEVYTVLNQCRYVACILLHQGHQSF